MVRGLNKKLLQIQKNFTKRNEKVTILHFIFYR